MICLFCQIIKRKVRSTIIYEDDKILVFEDIFPKAPVHLLAIPKKHIANIAELKEEDKEVMGHLMVKIPEIIEKVGLSERGVRVVNNCGHESGQSVFHIHFHIMGGRSFEWPPG